MSRRLPSFSLDNEEEDDERGGDEEYRQCGPAGIQQCRALLFDILSKHYGQASYQPLLPSGLTDVYTHVTELLGELEEQTTMSCDEIEMTFKPCVLLARYYKS